MNRIAVRMCRNGLSDVLVRGGALLMAMCFGLSPARGDPQAEPPPPASPPAAPSSGTPPTSPAPAPPNTAPPNVTPPKLASEPSFPYPEGASGDATVLLTLTINADGTVQEAVPAESNEPFSSQAVSHALDLIFEPARRDGVPIAVRIRFEVTFHATAPESKGAEKEGAEEGAGTSKEGATQPGQAGNAAGQTSTAAATDVVIRGVRPEPSRSATLSRAEVRLIPGTFGDPFRAVEAMPGVTPIVSGLPFFFIRGAPPGDVGYFLDGIRVPLLFHVGVGPSVIHPALIDRVDLYPGGYPARFGRFSGGIVSGETVDPAPRLHGEYQVRLYDAGALVETPFDGGRGSVLVGGRYSYTAELFTLLRPGVQLDYWDYQARASYEVAPGERIGVFAFGSYDYLGQITPTQVLTLFGAEFHRIDLRYDHRLGEDGQLRLATTIGVDRSRLPDDRFVIDRMAGLRMEMTYRLAPRALLRAGGDLEVDGYSVDFNTASLSPSAASVANLFPTRKDLAMGGRADVVLGLAPGFELTPGLRLDMYTSEGAAALAIDPRLALRLQLAPGLHFLSAMGIAHQAPAFVVPVPGFQPGGLRGGLQTALQQSVGLELELDDITLATATVFHNGFLNMSDPLSVQQPQPSGCPPGAFPITTLAGDRGSQPPGPVRCAASKFPGGQVGVLGPDPGEGADTVGSTNAAAAFETRTLGAAYGLELYLKRKLTSRLGGFLSYTLSRSVRSYAQNHFIASFDRTHVVNAALAYNLGESWRVGTRVIFYTGLPKAPDPLDSSTRLPPFFRVDLRLEKRWPLGPRAWISAVAEFMNATLSKEAVSTSCSLNGCQSMTIGPVSIPSLGVEGGF
jgi:hypothetical protein